MLENRSFDHVLGFMKKQNPNINGLNGDETQPLNCTDPNSPVYPLTDNARWVQADPDHSYSGNLDQIFGYGPISYPAPMTGFLEQVRMTCYNYHLS